MTQTNIVASVMGIQREGTLLSLRRGVNLLNVIITCIKLVLENSPIRLWVSKWRFFRGVRREELEFRRWCWCGWLSKAVGNSSQGGRTIFKDSIDDDRAMENHSEREWTKDSKRFLAVFCYIRPRVRWTGLFCLHPSGKNETSSRAFNASSLIKCNSQTIAKWLCHRIFLSEYADHNDARTHVTIITAQVAWRGVLHRKLNEMKAGVKRFIHESNEINP